MRYLFTLIILSGCIKKKEELPRTYAPPEIEWDDDLDIDDLPEAGDEDEEELH